MMPVVSRARQSGVEMYLIVRNRTLEGVTNPRMDHQWLTVSL